MTHTEPCSARIVLVLRSSFLLVGTFLPFLDIIRQQLYVFGNELQLFFYEHSLQPIFQMVYHPITWTQCDFTQPVSLLRVCKSYSICGSLALVIVLLECYMDWFPSLICKNYIFKHFVKTVEPTSLKFCTITELITLHLEYTIAQVKYANFSCAHAQTFVLLNGEMATVSTGLIKLKFWLWLLRTVFYLSQTGF